jgi:hypothetical protein
MPDNEVKIVINADGTAAVAAFNKTADAGKKMASEIDSSSSSMLGGLKAKWVALGAAAVAAFGMISKASEYIDIGAKAQQTEETFSSMTKQMGIDGEALIADMKRLTKETVDDSDLMQKAIKGITQGLSASDMTKIAEMSVVAARKGLIPVSEAYEQLADAIANKMPRSLVKMGLVSKEEAKNIQKAMDAGVEGVNLLSVAYENAQKQAAKMGPVTLSNYEKLQQLSVQAGELKEDLGKFIINNIDVSGITDALQSIRNMLKDNKEYIEQDLAYAWIGVEGTLKSILSLVGAIFGEMNAQSSTGFFEGWAYLGSVILPSIKDALVDMKNVVSDTTEGALKGWMAVGAALFFDFKKAAELGKEAVAAFSRAQDAAMRETLSKYDKEFEERKAKVTKSGGYVSPEFAKKEEPAPTGGATGGSKIGDSLKALAAAEKNAKDILSAEKEAFKIRLDQAKDFATDAVKEEESLQKQRLTVIDNALKLGLITEREAYDQKVDYIDYSMQKEIEAVQQGKDKQLAEIASWESQLKALYARLKAASKPEERSSISVQEEKDFAALAAKKIEIERDADNKITEIKTQGATDREALTVEEMTRQRQIKLESLQMEVDMVKESLSQELAARLDAIEQEESALKEQYSRLQVSPQEYHDKMIDLIDKRKEYKLSALEEEFKAEIDNAVKTAELYAEGSDEQRKIYEKLERYAKTYYGKVDDIARDSAKERIEIEREVYEEVASFADGVDQGMREYLKTLDWGFARGKDIVQEAMNSMRGYIKDVISGDTKISWKNTLDWMKGLFAQWLSDMMAMAVANPIKVVLSAVGGSLGGVTNAIAGTGGSTANLAGGASLLSSLPGLIPYLGPLLAGSLVGGNTGTGMAAGGVLGAGLSHMTIGALGMSSSLVGGALSGGASMLGLSVGSFVPIIGSIVGMALGALAGSLFGGGDKETRVKLRGQYTADEGFAFERKKPGKESYSELDPDYKITKYLTDYFGAIRTSLKDFGETINADMTAFDQTFEFGRKKFKTEKEFQKAVDDWTKKYIQTLTGQDWSQFQKDGEKLTDTVASLIQTVTTIQAIKDINVKDIYDEITLDMKSYAEQLQQKTNDISAAVTELNSLSGAEYRTKLEGIVTLTQDWYNSLVQYMTYLKSLSAEISADIKATQESMMLDTMQPAEKTQYYDTKVLELWDQMQKEADPTKLAALYEQYMDYFKKYWGSLTEEEKKAVLENKNAFLDAVEDLMTTKIGDAVVGTEKELQRLETELGKIDFSPLYTLKGSADSAATAISSLASAASSAASAMNSSSVAQAAEGLAYVPRDNYLVNLHKGERVLTSSENQAYNEIISMLGGFDLSNNSIKVIDGSHQSGLDYVPYDNYTANLHKGEAVLTAQGNKALVAILDRLAKMEQGGDQPVTVVFNVSEKADAIVSIVEAGGNNAIRKIRRNPALIQR